MGFRRTLAARFHLELVTRFRPQWARGQKTGGRARTGRGRSVASQQLTFESGRRTRAFEVRKTWIMRHNSRARRRSLFLIGALAGVAFLGGSALLSRSQTPESDTTREIAPGLTLRSVIAQTPQGPLRYWLVKAKPDVFRLGLEIPDSSNVQKKRTVRALAAQSGALVAVNGGFFAYGGAAVGAVKVGGTWQRLPWKSRTALGWNSATDAQIGPLSGVCQLRIETPDGRVQLQSAALNGFALPGTRAEIIDGFAVLTPMFARKYPLRTGEIALIIPPTGTSATGTFATGTSATGTSAINSMVSSAVTVQTTGDVDLQAARFVVIARGQAASGLDATRPPRFSYSVQTSPDWNGFANILGAGPRLIQNGRIKTTEIEEEFRPDVLARGPRTSMGWDSERNWLLLVADGRSASSVGLTLPEAAQLLGQLGAVEAMNLDGGSSTQLVVGGELVNTPSGLDPVNPTRPREVQVINALTLKAQAAP